MKNLISTIQISQDNSQLLPYLSEISFSDKYLLEKIANNLRPNSKNYEDSWGYIIQATRYGGFKWYDHHTGSLIFFGKKSPSESILVVPSAFAEPEYLTYVVAKVQNALNTSATILKNVGHEDVTTLLNFGFRRYNDDEAWCKEARFDDQTYPQLIIDLKLLKSHLGKIYQNLRTVFNKNPDFQIRKFVPSDVAQVISIINAIDRYKQTSSDNWQGAYYVSHIMYLTADINKYVIVDKNSGDLVGFTATSKISSISSALVASLFKPNTKNASVWGIYQTLMTMYQEGYQLANLGGCEVKGTHNFMRNTFRPVEQLGKTHLIYDNK